MTDYWIAVTFNLDAMLYICWCLLLIGNKESTKLLLLCPASIFLRVSTSYTAVRKIRQYWSYEPEGLQIIRGLLFNEESSTCVNIHLGIIHIQVSSLRRGGVCVLWMLLVCHSVVGRYSEIVVLVEGITVFKFNTKKPLYNQTFWIQIPLLPNHNVSFFLYQRLSIFSCDPCFDVPIPVSY